ncbi:uncharacterized protein [Spinacia oleracea]|uniref:Uncharacterized protein n=1 Tax=Spinacia oleracea TaxID=3562 RepID=A0ABM3R4V6_SPIOL|nr:uncharacterized protein LOC130465836 [Spinacia oleracea]
MYIQMRKRERPLFVLPGLFPNYFSLKKTSLFSPSLFLSQFPHRPSQSEKQESELVDVGSSVLDKLKDLYLKKLWHQPSRATKVHCSHKFQGLFYHLRRRPTPPYPGCRRLIQSLLSPPLTASKEAQVSRSHLFNIMF